MVNSLKIHGATAANTIHLGKECSIWNNKRFSSPYFFRSKFVTNRGNARLVALGDISQQVSWVLAYFSHCYYRHYIYCILNSVANSIKSIAFGENCNVWKSNSSRFPCLTLFSTKLATLNLTVFFCNGKYVFSFCVQKQKSIVNITLFWHFCIKIVPIWIQRLCLWYCLPNYVYISLFVWKYFKMRISGYSWSNS